MLSKAKLPRVHCDVLQGMNEKGALPAAQLYEHLITALAPSIRCAGTTVDDDPCNTIVGVRQDHACAILLIEPS